MKQILRLCNFVLLLLTIILIAQTNAKTQVDITIDRSGVLLKGKFYSAEGEGYFPTVILLGGLPGNEIDVLGIGKRLSEAGINVLTFNYSGVYQSEGLLNFDNSQKDIKAAYDFIHQQAIVNEYKIDTNKIFLGGYSYGGGMALTYAANHPEINAVFSIAGTDHGEFMREYISNPEFATMIDTMFEEFKTPNGPVRFDKGGIPSEIYKIGMESLEPYLDLRKAAPMLAPKEILLIAGWNDSAANIDNHILPLYRALQNENAESVEIIGFQDDHSFRNSRNEVTKTIIEWIKTSTERKKF